MSNVYYNAGGPNEVLQGPDLERPAPGTPCPCCDDPCCYSPCTRCLYEIDPSGFDLSDCKIPDAPPFIANAAPYHIGPPCVPDPGINVPITDWKFFPGCADLFFPCQNFGSARPCLKLLDGKAIAIGFNLREFGIGGEIWLPRKYVVSASVDPSACTGLLDGTGPPWDGKIQISCDGQLDFSPTDATLAGKALYRIAFSTECGAKEVHIWWWLDDPAGPGTPDEAPHFIGKKISGGRHEWIGTYANHGGCALGTVTVDKDPANGANDYDCCGTVLIWHGKRACPADRLPENPNGDAPVYERVGGCSPTPSSLAVTPAAPGPTGDGCCAVDLGVVREGAPTPIYPGTNKHMPRRTECQRLGVCLHAVHDGTTYDLGPIDWYKLTDKEPDRFTKPYYWPECGFYSNATATCWWVPNEDELKKIFDGLKESCCLPAPGVEHIVLLACTFRKSKRWWKPAFYHCGKPRYCGIPQYPELPGCCNRPPPHILPQPDEESEVSVVAAIACA